MAEIPVHHSTLPIRETRPWVRSAEQVVGPGPDIQALEDAIWSQVRQRLSQPDIERMVLAYNNQMENEEDKIPATATADELFETLRESGRSCILIWLQALLYHVSQELFDLVATLAMSKWPPLKIPHYSRVECGGVRPETPPGYRLIAMYVDFNWPRLLEEMIHLKETIAHTFQIDPDSLYIAEIFYSDSAWITILIPEHVIKDQGEQAFIQRLKTFPEIKDAKFGDPPLEALAQAGKEMTAKPSSSSSASASSAKSPSSKEEVKKQVSELVDLFRKPRQRDTQKRKAEADSTTEEPSEEIPEQAEKRKRFKMEQRWRGLPTETFLEYIKEDPEMLDAASTLKKSKFDIKNMSTLTPPALECMGLSKQMAIVLLAESEKLGVFETEITTKVLNDGLFGHLEFPLLCMKIIDTPEFQRLRDIKQLGSAFLVYPGAMHSRFQHSLGVAYLARKVVKALQKHQPSLDITEEDVLCVTIAGLCRDLGKGPHSHLFTKFMHTLHTQRHASGGKGKGGKKKKQAQTAKKWNPASTSLTMFNYIIEKNNAEIKKEMHRMGLDDVDIEFIREQIRGNTMDPQQKYIGREPEKHFLYEIVALRRNGIDVVRWDDIARDSAMLGLPVVFDHRRFVKHVRVLNTKDDMHICARDKDADDHYKMFQARHMLGQRAYFHKVNQAVEAMLEDVLLLVEESDMTFPGAKKELKLSECVDDPVAFSKLHDGIFYSVEMSTSDSLEKARKILQDIKGRRLYKMMDETPPHKQRQDYPIEFDLNRPNGIVVKELYIDYGWKDQDPLENMWFYKKEDPMQPVRIDRNKVSASLPEKFAECVTRLYCELSDGDTQREAVENFRAWRARSSSTKESPSHEEASKIGPITTAATTS